MRPLVADQRSALIAGLAAIGVFFAIALALFFVDQRVEAALSAQQTESVGRELQLLISIDSEEGRGALTRAVARESEKLSDDLVFGLFNADGSRIAGDFPSWPPNLALNGRWSEAGVAQGLMAHVTARVLGDGSRLIVGYDTLGQQDLRATIASAAFAAIAICLGLGFSVATAFNVSVLRRVDHIAHVARSISEGQVAARVPVEGKGTFAELAKTLNLMLDRNQATLDAMRTVTNSLAHDLRTPLARLHAFTETARRATSEEARTRALDSMEAEADHILVTFSALINLARAEAGLLKEGMSPVDLAALLGDVCDLFQPVAEEKGQMLSLNVEPIEINGHRQLLFQAVGNLVENAIKYAPEGLGISLQLRKEPGQALIVVRDQGPGIPWEERERALEPFKRLESGHSVPGTGLGLAIAAATAKLHGGSILFENENPGLCVRLTLPYSGSERPMQQAL